MAGVLSKADVDTANLHKDVLDATRDFLLGNLIFDCVHDQLIQTFALDRLQLEDIADEQKNSDKIRSLIERLRKSDWETYTKFKEALTQTKQKHIVEKLEATEKELRDKNRANGRGTQPVPPSPIASPMDGAGGCKDVHEPDGC